MKDRVTLKISIMTVDGQRLNPGDKGILAGFDADHWFVDFNGETVAFRKDEADEEIEIS
jgi:hypothetical protein